MKKFTQLIYNLIGLDVTGLDVLDDWPIFFGSDRRQERGKFLCKQRWTEDAKKNAHVL